LARTSVKSEQIKDAEVKRSDINITQTGEAMIRRLIAGTNISISSTGADSGTGDVTVSVSSTPNFSSLSIGSSTVIDSSRNITNIGTISNSGTITSTGSNIVHVVNSTTASTWGGYGVQRSGTYKGIIGNSFSANGLINGSVLDDLCIRNSQSILFSADDGTTKHLSLTSTDFTINTTNLKIGTATGQGLTADFYDNASGNTFRMVWTKGVLTSVTIV